MQDMRYVPIHGTPACIRLDMETTVHMLVACGIAQASMETMIVELAMYWQEAPSVEAGVLLAKVYEPVFSASSSQHLPESKKKLTRQKKSADIHFTVIHHVLFVTLFSFSFFLV